MSVTINWKSPNPYIVENNIQIPKFNTGDKVCYKQFPNTCIGTISPDSFIGTFDGVYNIFTSDDYFKTFTKMGGTNTLTEYEDNIMLYETK